MTRVFLKDIFDWSMEALGSHGFSHEEAHHCEVENTHTLPEFADFPLILGHMIPP